MESYYPHAIKDKIKKKIRLFLPFSIMPKRLQVNTEYMKKTVNTKEF